MRILSRYNILPLMLLMLVFAFSNSASAMNTVQTHFTLNAKETVALEKVRTVLSKYTYALGRDLMTFHYQSAELPESYRPNSLNEILKASLSWGATYFNAEAIGNDALGPGHYVATDLTGSRSFGGEHDPQLFVTVIKSYAKFLDGRAYLDEKDTATLKEAVNSLKCIEPIDGPKESDRVKAPKEGYLQEWLSYLRLSPTKSCRKVIIQAVKDLDAVALLYGYESANGFKNCRQNRGEAIVVISPDGIDLSQTAFFSNTKSFDPNHIAGFLKELYDEGARDLSVLSTLPKTERQMPTTFSTAKTDSVAFENEKAKNIYKCGPEWTSENDDMSVFAMVFEIKDPDIVVLQYQLNEAFSEKFPNQNPTKQDPAIDFDVKMLKGYNLMVSKLLGVPYKTWKAATIEYNKDEDDDDGDDPDDTAHVKATAKILGEEINLPIDIAKKSTIEKVYGFLKLAQKKPALTYAGLATIGLGPKVSTMLIDGFLASLDGIPFITGELPLTNDDNIAALTEQNRLAYTTYLKKCLKQYRDPNISKEQIMAGSCGLIKTK